jgi:hypothetical protein
MCCTAYATSHRSHQLYADLLVHFLESTYSRDCELASESQHWTIANKTFADTPVFGATTEKFERAICYGAAATSSFDAVDQSSYNRTISFETTAGVVMAESTTAGADASAVVHADWTITEDRAGKPGYIVEGVSHAVLTARMQCSAKQSSDAASLYIPVAVTYMQSYEGVGVVLMYGPHKHQPHLRGRRTQAAMISSQMKAAARGQSVEHSSKDSHSSYMIDALDVSAHVSPYVTEFLKLDPAFLVDSNAATLSSLNQTVAVEINFRSLNIGDVDFIQKHHRLSGGAADYGEVRNQWKFKLVRLSCC